MAAYHQIVCTNQTNCSSTGHIVAVGIGSDVTRANERLTVGAVWAAMDKGDVFYTSDAQGNVALVEKFYCGCRQGSLRSKADASKANNLDSLRLCSWAG
jgi:hypothetical protein